jgi:hypothetical protein
MKIIDWIMKRTYQHQTHSNKWEALKVIIDGKEIEAEEVKVDLGIQEKGLFGLAKSSFTLTVITKK